VCRRNTAGGVCVCASRPGTRMAEKRTKKRQSSWHPILRHWCRTARKSRQHCCNRYTIQKSISRGGV
jgi:hypothetical protein